MSSERPSKRMLDGAGKGPKAAIIAGILFTVAVALLCFCKPAFIRFLDYRFYDTSLRSAPQGAAKPSGLTAVVDIDEKSLVEYGQWPWPRHRVALLLRRLREMGALSVGIDAVLAEPDRTSLSLIRQDLYRDFGVILPTADIPVTAMDHDQALSAALTDGPFVVAHKFTFSDSRSSPSDCLLHPLNLALVGMNDSRPAWSIHKAANVVCTLKLISRKAALSGFVNIIPDTDGILRRAPLIVEYEGRFYPSLALATYMQAFGTTQVFLKAAGNEARSLRLAGTEIPLDAQGNVLIRYRGRSRTFDYISASDILKKTVRSGRIKGRIVFIGTSAAGLADMRPTPVDQVFPGVEVQATIVDNMLRKDFFSSPGWVPGLELLLVLAAGLLSTIALTRSGIILGSVFILLGALGLWGGSFWVLHHRGLFISPIVPLIALGGTFTLIILLRYNREKSKAKARAKQVINTQDFTIRCLASLTECRDAQTGGHILRTQRYVGVLCRRLASHPKFREVLDPETVEHLFKSSPLHDIGKVGVPDHILLKPGKLTDEEFEEMKKHTTYGRDAIRRAEEKFGTGTSGDFLRLAKEIAYTHHEKWDGTGYPEHLKGEEIPISGRIMALVDVYDALVSKRVYKTPFTHEQAVDVITRLKGVLFDPDIVEAFLNVHEEFKAIATQLSDEEGYAGVFGHV